MNLDPQTLIGAGWAGVVALVLGLVVWLVQQKAASNTIGQAEKKKHEKDLSDAIDSGDPDVGGAAGRRVQDDKDS